MTPIALSAIIRHTNPERILEIGTGDGYTTVNLAANSADHATVTTVDLPPDCNGKLAINVPSHAVNISGAITGSHIRDNRYAKKISQIYCDSVKLDWKTLPIPFDLIFVDGCHYYDYVKHDTEQALVHTKKGGILIWHDYGIIQDVSRAVDETGTQIKVRAVRGTSLAVGFVGQ